MTRTPIRLLSASLAAILALPMVAPLACTVPDQATLTDADYGRMIQFQSSRVRGLGEALRGDIEEERDTVAALYAPGLDVVDAVPDGKYRCRTIKLGGFLPLVTYNFFNCRISEGGTKIEKVSGSQRFTGTLTPTNDGIFYQGALHYNGDPANSYGTDDEFNQVGCVYKIAGENRYILEMPLPLRESTHDVIVLVP